MFTACQSAILITNANELGFLSIHPGLLPSQMCTSSARDEAGHLWPGILFHLLQSMNCAKQGSYIQICNNASLLSSCVLISFVFIPSMWLCHQSHSTMCLSPPSSYSPWSNVFLGPVHTITAIPLLLGPAAAWLCHQAGHGTQSILHQYIP